jgi:hypothetical protein
MGTRLEQVTPAEYDAARRKYMGSHSLERFRRSPLEFQLMAKGMLLDKDSSAYAFGRAFHCWFLEGEAAFHRRYVVSEGPINERTQKPFGRDTKAFTDWMADNLQPGQELITGDEFHRIQQMADATKQTAGIEMLDDGEPEQTIRGDIFGVDCQSRLDWLNATGGYFVDIKTDAELDTFVYRFGKFGYARQLAFYREMVRALGTGQDWAVFVLAIEKESPFRSQMYRVMDSTLLAAREEVLQSLEQYKALWLRGDDFEWPISLVYGQKLEVI